MTFFREAALHLLVALAVPVLLVFAARRASTPGIQMALLAIAVIIFVVVFFASYSVFCAGCQ